MQSRKTIAHLPLLVGLALSIALHVAVLRGKSFPDSAPAKPIAQQGRTVVQLTLVPSIASKGNPEPESRADDINVAPTPAPPVEQAFQPAPPAKPVVKPPPPKKQTPPPKPKAPSPEPFSKPSPEQDASLIQEKGVTTEAHATETASPTYPRLSRKRGEEGTVTLSIEVFANGNAGKIKIIQSSGHRRLDQAALKAAQRTQFAPAQKSGKAISSTTQLSFTFRLTEE
jgi:protein TonB